MRGFNRITALGHVGQDPEIKHLANGDAVASFSVACSESWKDKHSGEKKERTEWLRCSAFGKLAEIIGQYVHKGDPLFIEGQLRTDTWEDNQGVKKSATKIIVDQIRLLGDGKGKQEAQSAPANNQSQRPAPSQRQAPPRDAPPQDDFDDNSVPF